MKLTIEEIRELQDKYGFKSLQDAIDDGSIWRMPGHNGREAMDALRAGICILPNQAFKDYWGNKVPSIDQVAPGSIGSLELAQKYWSNHDF